MPQIICRHETDATGEWTCNLPQYDCEYAAYNDDPYATGTGVRKNPPASTSGSSRGTSGESTSLENAVMGMADASLAGFTITPDPEVQAQIRRLLPRTVRGLVVQDTRTGDWGTVTSGVEWASGQTVVRIQLHLSDITVWVPTSKLILI